MTFEERLDEMARHMAESQRRWEERDEKIQQRLNNLAATFSEEHWRFQEDMRSLKERFQDLQQNQQGLQTLVFQIAEGTARLLNTIEAHEKRLDRLGDQDRP